MEEKSELVTIEKSKLQELVKSFYDVCIFFNEMMDYKYRDLEESKREMKSWVDDNFGRNLENLK